MLGSILFLVFFYTHQLYADAMLQIFFIVTSVMGWWKWINLYDTNELAITSVSIKSLTTVAIVGLIVTLVYAWVLHAYTDDFMPLVDAGVLVLSIIGQVLLMNKKIETWIIWILVNTISVYLYVSRGMIITSVLYVAYWVNAWYSTFQWRKLCEEV